MANCNLCSQGLWGAETPATQFMMSQILLRKPKGENCQKPMSLELDESNILKQNNCIITSHKSPMYHLKCRNLCCNSQRVIGWILFESYHNPAYKVQYFTGCYKLHICTQRIIPGLESQDHPYLQPDHWGKTKRSPWLLTTGTVRPGIILQGLGVGCFTSQLAPFSTGTSPFLQIGACRTNYGGCVFFKSPENKEKTTTTTYKKRSNHCVWNWGNLCVSLGISRYDLCIQEFQTVTVGGQEF